MGYSLSATSLSRLNGVHPNLVKVVKRAIEVTNQDFVVQEGLRTLATQKQYLAKGVTKTLNSKHLKQSDGFGHAVDLVPLVNGKPMWEWPLIWEIAVAMDVAAAELDVELTWGAVWDRTLSQYGGTVARLKQEVEAYKKRHPGPDFLDAPHYQL